MFVKVTVVFLLPCLCLAFSADVLGGATPTITATGQLRKREEVTHSQLKEELRDVERKLLNALQKQCPARVPQIDELREKLLTMEAGLQATQAALKSLMQSTSRQNATAASSTFIRWGRKTCTINSHLVYSGVAGGSLYTDTGAAANHLCLTETPELDNEPIPRYYSTLYGAEYEHIGSHHNHDVLCSVCRAPQSTTIMVPATHTCPPGWTTQYTGHLVAGYYGHKAATEYVCLDGTPEDAVGGHQDQDGNLFYYTVTRCGSLPCPPFVNNKVALCAVCST